MLVNEEGIEPGDLVVINSSKSKLKPRETHLVQDVEQINGSDWAHAYKMADKMTNRPQLVKVEDLTRVPTKRKAALAAKKAIKDLVRYIFFMQETPTHAWRHEDWIDECLETDDEDEEEGETNEEDATSSHLGESAVLKPTLPFSDTSSSQDLPRSRPKLPPRHPRSRSRIQPSPLTITPQSQEAVQLDMVQNLSQAFDDIYRDPSEVTRTSDRIASMPKRDYRRLHNFGE